jgi:stage III sporulation protein SpoIIIAA
MRSVEQAAAVLPRELRLALLSQGAQLAQCEEIRLRCGRGLSWSQSDGTEKTVHVAGAPMSVTAEDLRMTVELAARASLQTVQEKLASGFLPLQGGHRLGLCGTAAVICPVGKVVAKDKTIEFPSGMQEMGPVLTKLYNTLRGVQMGTVEAPEGWIREIK